MAVATPPASVPVGSLTDAELAVLALPRTRVGPRPVMPVWSRLPRGRRDTAAREARAALVTRRLVDPDPRSRSDVRRDLRSVLVLRACASVVVAATRATPRGRDHWYAHLVGEVVLLEQVGTDGVHRFALTAAATLPDLVVAAVLHPQAVASATPGPGAETDWLHADVELRGASGPRRLSWVSGPGGTWRVAAHGGPEPVSPAAVRRSLAAALAELTHGEGDDED